MPPPHSGQLGIMKPLGGGDPIPLVKPELVVGRRPTNDVCLDFENVSGKHCSLRLINGLWHVRDLGSSNGTTVNGSKIVSEHTVMPDDELGISGHLYHLDYELAGPATVAAGAAVSDDDDVLEVRKKTSLIELAGLGENRPARARPAKAPAKIERMSVDEGEFDDALPEHVKKAPAPKVATNDDDFLKIFDDEAPK